MRGTLQSAEVDLFGSLEMPGVLIGDYRPGQPTGAPVTFINQADCHRASHGDSHTTPFSAHLSFKSALSLFVYFPQTFQGHCIHHAIYAFGFGDG